MGVYVKKRWERSYSFLAVAIVLVKATVLKGVDCLDDEFFERVFDFEEGEARERYYYYTALYSDEEGEVELREYVINGDAREEESYRFTGKPWPVLYSYNTVSR